MSDEIRKSSITFYFPKHGAGRIDQVFMVVMLLGSSHITTKMHSSIGENTSFILKVTQ